MFLPSVFPSSLVVTIMAGGEGKRMRSDLPKVLHLFKGRPMLVWVIEAAMGLCPEKIVVVTGRFHEMIIRSLSEYFDIFGIIFVQQQTPQGTGDAINQCLRFFTQTDRVLILNGDMPLVTKEILGEFIQKAKTECVVLSTVLENPTGYGRIIAPDFVLEKIVEERDATTEQRAICQVNAGIYFIRSDVLHTYIPLISNKNAQKEYYLTDIVQLIYEYPTGSRVSTVLIEDSQSLRGINTPEELSSLSLVYNEYYK